jgi:hypothetical protein
MPASSLHSGLILIFGFSAIALMLSEGPYASGTSNDTSILEMLREEELDTITLDRAVHFTTPQANDVVTPAGTYRVGLEEAMRLRLFALKNKTVTIIDALTIRHQTDIGQPVALYLQDDRKIPHLVLLLPGGKGFEAVGSYDDIRSRGLESTELTETQLMRAFKDKVKRIEQR